MCVACHLIVRNEIDHHHRLCCASHNAYTERQSMSCFLQLIICKLQFDVGIWNAEQIGCEAIPVQPGSRAVWPTVDTSSGRCACRYICKLCIAETLYWQQCFDCGVKCFSTCCKIFHQCFNTVVCMTGNTSDLSKPCVSNLQRFFGRRVRCSGSA